ncbi:MAG: hypothetical protein K0V04_10895 [Deltaproteobacteria bacterium]|nr:hypothetical protein [Deltaproteobacteria bacterium]
MAFFVTTRLNNTPPRQQRSAFAPRTLWLLGRPQVGRSMALIDSAGQSLVTSRIQRIMHGPERDSIYVQTHNSLYQLQETPLPYDETVTPP